jgi:hypothetical protein
MQELHNELKPGARVRVTQQIAARDYAMATEVVGTVVVFEQRKTASWFAHARDNRLWLDRLVLRKADGEISTLVLDASSRVELLAAQ